MVKLALGLVIMSVFVGCKSAAKTPVKAQAESAFGADDDGAIDVPKELEEKASLTQNPSLTSRSRLTRENVSKELKPGSKLSVKVRGMRTLQLDVFAQNSLDKVSLNLQGSSLKSIDLKSAMSSLEIPVKSSGDETVEVAIPEGKDFGLQMTQLMPKEGGEIISWKILAR